VNFLKKIHQFGSTYLKLHNNFKHQKNLFLIIDFLKTVPIYLQNKLLLNIQKNKQRISLKSMIILSGKLFLCF
jgi:hypothetical protein